MEGNLIPLDSEYKFQRYILMSLLFNGNTRLGHYQRCPILYYFSLFFLPLYAASQWRGKRRRRTGTSSQWVAPSSHFLSATASDVKGGDSVDQRVLVLKDLHQTSPCEEGTEASSLHSPLPCDVHVEAPTRVTCHNAIQKPAPIHQTWVVFVHQELVQLIITLLYEIRISTYNMATTVRTSPSLVIKSSHVNL